MSSEQSKESKDAQAMNRQLAERYYGVALPALQERQGAINVSLARGEAPYLESAFAGQRTGLTEGLAARGGAAEAQKFGLGKKALSGGNIGFGLTPADIGAQLANALYGSKFQEGQANLDQQFNLISMGLGGAGQAGSGALTAAGNQLNAIQYLPAYNQTYAGIVGGTALGAGIYGAGQQAGWWGSPALAPAGSVGWGLGSAGGAGAGLGGGG